MRYIELEKDEEIVVTQGRTCGDCRLCCKLVGVFDQEDGKLVFEKEPYEWCQHACNTGCSIYETRPNGCRNYSCLWLEGLGTEDDRPDKLHILAHIEGVPLGPDGEKQPAACVYQQNPGAWKNKRAQTWLKLLAKALKGRVRIGTMEKADESHVRWTPLQG
jgi:hypothetical protein